MELFKKGKKVLTLEILWCQIGLKIETNFTADFWCGTKTLVQLSLRAFSRSIRQFIKQVPGQVAPRLII